MPVLSITAAEATAAMALGASALRYIMDDLAVRAEVQAVVYHQGFNTIPRFVGIEETKASVRQAAEQLFGLKGSDGIQERRDLADLVNVWENAKIQHTKTLELRAERIALDLVQPAGALDASSMRKAHERIHGDLESRLVPGRYLLGTKLDQVQSNEPEVEHLKDVGSKDDGDEETLTSEVGKDGRLVIRKGIHKEVPPPKDAEELRTRYRLLGHAWEFAGLKHPGRTWLVDYGVATYAKLADYVLGPKVAGLRVLRNPSDANSEVRPNWQTVLNYEFQIRKKAFELVRKGNITAVAALEAAMIDQEIRGLHFIAIFQVQSVSRAQAKAEPGNKTNGPKKAQKQQKGSTKKTEGSTKTHSGGKFKMELKSVTPDGREICYKFGRKSSKCDGSCGRVHVCQVCLKSDHGFESCPTYLAASKKN
jgi:hypothetical protein